MLLQCAYTVMRPSKHQQMGSQHFFGTILSGLYAPSDKKTYKHNNERCEKAANSAAHFCSLKLCNTTIFALKDSKIKLVVKKMLNLL